MGTRVELFSGGNMKVTLVLEKSKAVPQDEYFDHAGYIYSSTAKVVTDYSTVMFTDGHRTARVIIYNREVYSGVSFENSLRWVRQFGYILEE